MLLHHESYGQGPPLIIMHGLLGSLDNWRTMGKKLGAHFRVFAVDLRNHGRSPHSDDLSYQLMAEDLKEFMDLHSIDAACLLGHSMGGKVAMRFAVLWPERVDKLVVADIAPKTYELRHSEILNALVSLDLERFSDRMEIGGALLEIIADQAMRRFLLKNLARDNMGNLTWRMNLKSIVRNYGEIVAGIGGEDSCHAPALFLRGAESDYIGKEDMSLIKRFFLHARLVTIPNAGHWLHVDAPEEFHTAVLDFLQAA